MNIEIVHLDLLTVQQTISLIYTFQQYRRFIYNKWKFYNSITLMASILIYSYLDIDLQYLTYFDKNDSICLPGGLKMEKWIVIMIKYLYTRVWCNPSPSSEITA